MIDSYNAMISKIRMIAIVIENKKIQTMNLVILISMRWKTPIRDFKASLLKYKISNLHILQRNYKKETIKGLRKIVSLITIWRAPSINWVTQITAKIQFRILRPTPKSSKTFTNILNQKSKKNSEEKISKKESSNYSKR